MLTELDIINSMLRTIGIDGLTSSDSTHPDYAAAHAVLEDVRQDVNNLGYWYNTSYPSLSANLDGEIVLPSNTLSVDPVDRSKNYTQRGSRLFDMDNRTYIIGEAVQVRLVENLTLDLMPPTAISYVRAVARFEFFGDNDGEAQRLARLEYARNTAWQQFYSEHIKNRNINHKDSPSSRMMRRGQRGSSNERTVAGNFI